MAGHSDDIRVADAHAMPISDVAGRLEIAGLKRAGVERVGPCPVCGGRDRFAINPQKNLFTCRHCGGGDQIRLVELVKGLSFRDALDWLCGPAEGLTDEERRARKASAEKAEVKRAAEAEKYRRDAIAAARKIWRQGVDAEDTPVRDYLTLRGITRDVLPALPSCLRYHPDCRYMLPAGPGQWVEVHRGPAMLAAVQGMDGTGGAVHRTFLDPAQPKGKLVLPDPANPEDLLQAKKVLGSKKGGAIRLHTPPEARVLIMGEGIETTLSARIVDAIPQAAYWAGVDLGNMAGRRKLGKGLKYAGIPDLDDDEAFVPPPWVERLIFIQDGDSEPRETRAKLLSGLRRAMALRPGLVGQIVTVGPGRDLNDVLMGKGAEDGLPED